MTIVNGRKGKDAFTCVSKKGCSVVDYCIVGSEDFDAVKNFMVTTMSESMVEMGCNGAVTRVPDHFLLHRQVVVDGVYETKEDEEIMREEVDRPLSQLKQKAVPRSDGLTAEMGSSIRS